MPPRFPATLESEIGAAGAWSNGGIPQTAETTPELMWPRSVAVYDQMRRTDSEVAAIDRAVKLPIRRTAWRIQPSDDVRPEVATFVAVELGLTEPGGGRQRRGGHGISWDPFLRHALLMLDFGHMFFEPVYAVGPPQPGQEGLEDRLYAHLAKLGPRLPRTLTGIDINTDGTLKDIRQLVQNEQGRSEERTIPALGPTGLPNLVPFINEQEGADFCGSSIFRSAYKHWFLKEMLERVGVQVVERNGMGLPVVTGPEGGDETKGLAIATSARAGEQSGIYMPPGYTFKLEGVSGTIADGLPLVKYHQQAIGRSALAMFLDLGQDRGARSLAETFVDFFTIAVNAVIADVEEIVTEWIIRPLVILNFGEDEPYPQVVADEITPQAPLTADAIASLVTAGIVQPDEPLEADVRRKFGLPPAAAPMPAGGMPTPGMPNDGGPETEDTIDVGGGSGGGAGGSSMSGRAHGSVRAMTARLTDARRKVNEARALLRR